MRRKIAAVFATIGWFAVAAQYYLMIESRVMPVMEATIRFLSYFTILTNLLVALYFTLETFRATTPRPPGQHPGTLTAITVYITVVGLGYQLLLRHVWDPTGLQLVVDELLHSVIPLLMIAYWYLYEHKQGIRYAQVVKWLVYPLLYLVYILLRGWASGFYPYPFVDVSSLGLARVLIHAALFALAFVVLSVGFIRLGLAFRKER